MREKSKYFKKNKSTSEFAFRLFIFLRHVFLTFYIVFKKNNKVKAYLFAQLNGQNIAM